MVAAKLTKEGETMEDGTMVSVMGDEVDGARLLAALYNNTRAIGFGVLHDKPRGMTPKEAGVILAERGRFSFDYVQGRPIKIRCLKGEIDAGDIRLYERDAGQGAFVRAFSEATAEGGG